MAIRLSPVDPDRAQGAAHELLAGVKAQLGMTPNMMRTMALSPAVLKGYLQLNAALAGGALPAKTREALALVVGESNGCNYCVAAHTALGGRAGLNADQIDSARCGTGIDAKSTAALRLARSILASHGEVPDAELNTARCAGLSDAEIAEVAAHVGLNVLTNYFNQLAHTEIDFPAVRLVENPPQPAALSL
jgi:uncharacterized peroxidase-related enzyme